MGTQKQSPELRLKKREHQHKVKGEKTGWNWEAGPWTTGKKTRKSGVNGGVEGGVKGCWWIKCDQDGEPAAGLNNVRVIRDLGKTCSVK